LAIINIEQDKTQISISARTPGGERWTVLEFVMIGLVMSLILEKHFVVVVL